MRVLAACLLGVLGLSALGTMAACSDSTDMGSAGAGGGSTAGSGGKGDGGKASTAGTGGGAVDCAFEGDACTKCLYVDHCTAALTACGSDAVCGGQLDPLDACLCGDASMTNAQCQTAFITAGGAKAKTLSDCYVANCTAACSQ